MSIEFKTEGASATGGGSAATLHTVPANKNTIIHRIRIHNSGSTTSVAQVKIGSLLVNEKSLTADEVWIVGTEAGTEPEKLGLGATDALTVQSETAGGDMDIVFTRQTIPA